MLTECVGSNFAVRRGIDRVINFFTLTRMVVFIPGYGTTTKKGVTQGALPKECLSGGENRLAHCKRTGSLRRGRSAISL